MSVVILPDTGPDDLVFFDVVTSHTVEETSIVTEHEVETGANPADHVRELPVTITIVGFVTNTPINPLPDGRGAFEDFDFEIPRWEPPLEPTPGSAFRALGGLAGDAIGAVGDAIFGATPDPKLRVLTFPQMDRILEVEQLLTRIRREVIRCSVLTDERQYASMLITANVHTKIVAGGKEFTVTLTELRTATTETVDAPQPAELRGVGKANGGAATTKPVESKEAAKGVSLARKLADSITGAL